MGTFLPEMRIMMFAVELFPINRRHQHVATMEQAEVNITVWINEFPINRRHQRMATSLR